MSFDVTMPEAAGLSRRPVLIPPSYALASTFVFCCGTSFLRGPAAAGAALVFALGLALAFRRRIEKSALRRILVPVNLFLLFLVLTLPLSFTPGPALFSIGPLHIRASGLWTALVVVMKANAVALVFIALLSPYVFAEICAGLRALRFPERLITLLHLALHHIFTLRQEWNRLTTAARLRGFTPRCNPHTYRTAANLLGMLLVNTYTRCERIEEAMLLRGFTGKFPVFLPEYPHGAAVKRRAWSIFAALTLASAILLALDMVVRS